MNIQLDVVLYLAAGLTTIATAIGILSKMGKKAIARITKEITKEIEQSFDKKFTSRLNEMNENLKSMIEENRERDERTRYLTIKNSASRIFEAHSHYIRRGSISTFALANLEEIFQEYSKTANGYAKLCMEQLRQLPICEVYEERQVVDMEERVSYKEICEEG